MYKRQVKDIAKKSAFAYKAKESNIIVVDTLSLAGPKTKDFISILNNLNVSGVRSLVLISEANQNVFLSSRNIPQTSVVEATQAGIFEVMNAKKIVITEKAVKELEANLSNN